MIEWVGKYQRGAGQSLPAAQLLQNLGKFLERQSRAALLLWLRWRHRRWLHADNDGWASMGYALTTLGRSGSTGRWMRDWRERANLQMWMLYNLALALRQRRRWNEAVELLAYAVKLPQRDHTFQQLRLMLAMELALIGNTQEASRHYHELNATGWSPYMLIQYRLTRGMLSVQEAAAGKKLKVFKTERRELRAFLRKQRTSTRRLDYRRSLRHMAKDTGSKWAVFTAWIWP